jgi:hypothetical protein
LKDIEPPDPRGKFGVELDQVLTDEIIDQQPATSPMKSWDPGPRQP